MKDLVAFAFATTMLTPLGVARADTPPAVSTAVYAEPRATATLRTPEPVWVNQMAELEVVLYRDDAEPDKSPPDFAEMRVPNAIALRTDYAPPPEVRTIEGATYLLQKRRYLVFPQGAGTINVPSIEVSWIERDGSRARVRTESVSFVAKLPAGAGSSPYVVATSLALHQTFDGDLDGLRVGDSFTRTVVIEATGTDAMMIPAMDVGTPDQLAAYPSQADIGTTVYRGRYDASRTDATTFVAESFGWTSLPEVSVRWLNPNTGDWRIETLPGRSLRVRVNPSLGWTALGGADSNALRLGGLAFLVLAGWIAWTFWRRRGMPRESKRESTRSSERTLFLRLLNEAYRDDALGALNATYRWMGALRDVPPTLSDLCQSADQTDAEAVTLQRALFGAGDVAHAWSGRRFASLLRRVRRVRGRPESESKLPSLNPGQPGRRPSAPS